MTVDADHWLIPFSFMLCCDFIINNKSSVCVGVSQITRTVYMLPLIGSKWPGWEKYQQMNCGCCARLFISAESNKQAFISLADQCESNSCERATVCGTNLVSKDHSQ